MERHIGTWHKENDSNKSEVGELLIDGNHLEFYSRFHGLVFSETFIGEDGQFRYKVFVNGYAKPGQNRILDFTSSHRVFYVLKQNFDFSKGTDISGVEEFSFTIRELTEWLGIQTVFYCCTDQDEPAAGEKHLDPIVIHETDPQIELYFESKTYESISSLEDDIAIKIKKEPRIRVTYNHPSDIQRIQNDIECIMQFFGLLIGKVSTADNIRLSIEGQKSKSWLYINHDYSYNLMNRDVMDRPRTYHYVLGDNLILYFANWRKFCFDDQFILLRRIYFSVNDRKEIFAEEVFVEYMRILDGYHTRISGDAETEEKLKKALKAASKVIKTRIFEEENRPIFEEAFQSVLPDWKYNSSNIGDISGWIAAGYLGRKSLSHRLKELDNLYFGIIRNNAEDIERLASNTEKCKDMTDEQIVELFYRELGDTRNYYSHYKKDKTGVLDFSQMNDAIRVLKATIISIFLSHMGIDKDLIRRIVEFDSELHFQTMFLRKPEERPFLHTQEWLKTIEIESATQSEDSNS